MKNIYVVSLDDEVPLTPKIEDEMKVLAYLVYDELDSYDEFDHKSILCHDDIIYNELLEKNVGNDYVHRFKYDDITSGMYEPFMIDARSFAFTVNEGTISEAELKEIIHNVRRYTRISYHININSVSYKEDKKEKNRLLAIKKLLLESKKKNSKEEGNTKIKTKSILPVIGLILR